MLNKKVTIILFISILFLPFNYLRAGTISSLYKYAWSNNIGYINFEKVVVNDNALSGTAWSENKGLISFSPNHGRVLNDGNGNLSGSAWGEQLGWIDFDNVSIDPTTGKFSGTAAGTLIGTVTFDCLNYCDVRTDWRQSIPPPASGSSSGGGSSGGGGGGSSGGTGVGILPNLPNSGIATIVANNALYPNISNMVFVSSGFPKNNLADTPPTENVTFTSPAISGRQAALFDVVSEPIKTKVAPGELLPVQVRLSNFGGLQRTDVLVRYSIFSDTGEEIYSTSETVAVETTASFIKTIQIPLDTVPGTYIAETSITYDGQLVPAFAQFPFRVERKFLGIFMSDWIVYGVATLLISAACFLAGFILFRRRSRREVLHDYADKPKDERIYYEMVSDIITQMRLRAGGRALVIAAHTEGLSIDKETGRVEKIVGSPAKVVAGLIAGYEKALDKKVSFSLRETKD